MAASALILPKSHPDKIHPLSIVKPIDLPLEEQVVNSMRRDLERLNWKFTLPKKKNTYPTLVPPASYDKETIKKSMAFKRDEIIEKHKHWIEKNIDFARKEFG